MSVSIIIFCKGLLFQAVITAYNIILSEKYENGILNSKYISTVRVISSVIIVFIF